jgi:long-chain acyl-CoA synthetase
MFIKELLERQQNNSKVAIKYGESSLTYKQWFDQSKDISKKLDKYLADSSQNIAIFLPNSNEYAIAYFSILFSNRTIIPIGTQSKKMELCSTLKYCEVDLIISKKEFRDFLIDALLDYESKIAILFVDDKSIEIINENNDYIEKSGWLTKTNTEDDVVIMLHTSGTTSNPKRVMLTNNNLINNIESNIASLKFKSEDKALIAIPMFFGYCNTAQFLTHLYLGASIVIMDRLFFPKLFLEIIQAERITNFTGVPSNMLMLLEYKNYKKYDFSSLRYICFGGAVKRQIIAN